VEVPSQDVLPLPRRAWWDALVGVGGCVTCWRPEEAPSAASCSRLPPRLRSSNHQKLIKNSGCLNITLKSGDPVRSHVSDQKGLVSEPQQPQPHGRAVTQYTVAALSASDALLPPPAGV
jgi:hypothetical protein